METDLKQLKCGECGESRFELYLRPNGEVITECIKCKSKAEIVIREPKIDIKNLEGLGIPCIFN